MLMLIKYVIPNGLDDVNVGVPEEGEHDAAAVEQKLLLA